MKRFTVPAFVAAIALAFSVGLAGCSSSQSINEDTLTGIWALDAESDLGFDAYANFEVDDEYEESEQHQFQIMLGEAYLNGTWEISGAEVTLKIEEGSDYVAVDDGDDSANKVREVKMTYNGSKLVLGSQQGSRLVFEPTDSEEARNALGIYEEHIEDIAAVSVADDDKVKIEVTGKGNNDYGEKGYRVSITNKTDKTIYVDTAEDFTLDGEEAYGYLELDDYAYSIAKGDTVDGFLVVEGEVYTTDNLDEIGEIAGTLLVYDYDAVEKIYDDFYGADDESDDELDADADDDADADEDADDELDDDAEGDEEVDDEEPDLSSALLGSYKIEIK